VFDASKEVQKELCLFMSHHQIVAGQNYKKPHRKCGKFKIFGNGSYKSKLHS
jgi:hypothetical protein